MITRNEMTIYFGMPSLILPVSSSETQRQWLQVCGFLNPTSEVVAARRCHHHYRLALQYSFILGLGF